MRDHNDPASLKRARPARRSNRRSRRAATLALGPRQIAYSGRPFRSRRSHRFVPNFSASNALSSTPRVWRPHSTLHPTREAGPSARQTALRQHQSSYRDLSRRRPGKSRRVSRSRRRPNGCWTIFISSTNRSARSRTICRPAIYRKLPKLADGPLQGYPRVFGVAWALIAHTDSAFDIQKLTRFVEAYQRVQPLTIGELWALAITLRITLVENLRRLAEAIVARLIGGPVGRCARGPDLWARPTRDPEPASAILHSLDQAPWSTAFAVELAQRLRDHDPNTTPALRWLNDKIGGGRNDHRSDRSRGGPAPERNERDRAQCDHEHAPGLDDQLGGVLRKRQSGRCGVARRQRFRGDGFSDTRPLPPRDRGTCARDPAATKSRWPGGRSRPPNARRTRRPKRIRVSGAKAIRGII